MNPNRKTFSQSLPILLSAFFTIEKVLLCVSTVNLPDPLPPLSGTLSLRCQRMWNPFRHRYGIRPSCAFWKNPVVTLKAHQFKRTLLPVETQAIVPVAAVQPVAVDALEVIEGQIAVHLSFPLNSKQNLLYSGRSPSSPKCGAPVYSGSPGQESLE